MHAREKKPQRSTDPTEKKKVTVDRMGMIQATHTNRRHAQKKWLGTKRMLCDATQWRYHKKIHTYGGKDEI